MPKLTLLFGALLILVGLAGFFAGHPDPATGHVSYTALIPAWIGLALALFGALAHIPAARMHAMHAAVLVALLALIGDGMQLLKTLQSTTTPPAVARLKILSMSATLLLCLIFLALAIRSFIHARRSAGQQSIT
jgi:hypothetical protein